MGGMEYVVVAVVLLIVALGGGLALLAPRRRRRGAQPEPPTSTTPQRGTGSTAPGTAPEATTTPQATTTTTPQATTTTAPQTAATAPGGQLPAVPADRAPVVPPAQPAVVPPAAGAAPEAVPVEVPEPTAGRLVRLRTRLSRSQNAFGKGLLSLLSRDKLDDETWDEIEETLITADVGVAATTEIVARLRERARVLGTGSATALRTLLVEELVAALDPAMDRSIATAASGGAPAVILVVGVNGAGKTTTCGKIARVLVADGHSVLLGAADTFRAAAADQLATWGGRVGADVVRGPERADPASVAFDAVRRGIEVGVQTVLIDTAGRLQNKIGLMDELGKVKRVVEKHGPIGETLLVLDATTGQNGLEQARVFTDVVQVTGVVLTKLDGTAKGGIVLAVQRNLGIPVKLVGLGEGPDDLAPFDPQAFVDALVGTAA